LITDGHLKTLIPENTNGRDPAYADANDQSFPVRAVKQHFTLP